MSLKRPNQTSKCYEINILKMIIATILLVIICKRWYCLIEMLGLSEWTDQVGEIDFTYILNEMFLTKYYLNYVKLLLIGILHVTRFIITIRARDRLHNLRRDVDMNLFHFPFKIAETTKHYNTV